VVEVMTDELDVILRTEPARPGVILEKDGTTPRSVFNPHLYSDVYERVIRHPRLLNAVEELLGEQAYCYQLAINCKAAFNGDVWFWHQDYPTYRFDDNIAEPRMVNTLIFLDEVTHVNGPLMIVPGSHHLEPVKTEETTGGTSYTLRYATPDAIESEVRRGGLEVPTGPAGSASIPGALVNGTTTAYRPRALSADGRRVFFDSEDSLVGGDTNSRPDVYEWEAFGAGSCTAKPGCVSLVSGGRGDGGTFLDASADGVDAFFLTGDSLVASDPGSIDAYDARVGGGLPEPQAPIPCNGDACQSLPNSPEDPTAGTSVETPGNPPPHYAKERHRRHHKHRHHHRGHRRKGSR